MDIFMFVPGPGLILFPFILLLVVLPFVIRFVVMPMIIGKIRASYEPIESSPMMLVHFCSHCGKPVSGNAGACMSCGTVPTGYRNFCCQCGVPINPDQVICIRCGATVASGMSANQVTPPPPGADIRQVKDYLEEAIIDLLFVLPLGVMAMIFSFQTLNAKKNNDYYRAVHYSNVTKWLVYAVRIVVAIVVFTIAGIVLINGFALLWEG